MDETEEDEDGDTDGCEWELGTTELEPGWEMRLSAQEGIPVSAALLPLHLITYNSIWR